MSEIKVFHRYINSKNDIDEINEGNPFGLTLELQSHDQVDLQIYGVCSKTVSLWRTKTKTAFRSQLKQTRGQLHIRVAVKGSFKYEKGQYGYINDHSHTIIVASDNNAFMAQNDCDVICLDLSRSKIEKYLSSLMKNPINFNRDYTAIEIGLSEYQDFCEFLQKTHDTVVQTEENINVLYPLFEEMLMSKFRLFIQENYEKISSAKNYSKTTDLALQFINENLQRKISVSIMALEIGVSISTLEKKFKKDIGITPIHYIVNRRLDMVHQELLESSKFQYISQIAMRWGFEHMADFSRRYKLRFGRSPSETREHI